MPNNHLTTKSLQKRPTLKSLFSQSSHSNQSIKTTSNTSTTTMSTADRARMEDEELSKVLEESESLHKRSQLLLAQMETEQLEHATVESKTLQEIHKARLQLLEQAEQDTLDLVIQQSRIHSHPNQLEERERLEMELALALSLNHSNGLPLPSSSTSLSPVLHPTPPAITQLHEQNDSASDSSDHDTESLDDPFRDPPQDPLEPVDHIQTLYRSLKQRVTSTPLLPPHSSIASPHPSPQPASLSLPPSLALPPTSSTPQSSSLSPPSVPSPSSLPPPPPVASLAPSLSPRSVPLPTSSSSSSSNNDQLTSASASSNYFPTRSPCPPSPPLLLLGKPQPPVPDRSRKPSAPQTSYVDQGRSTPSKLAVCTRQLSEWNSTAIKPSFPPSTAPGLPSTSSPTSYEYQDEPPSYELISPQIVISPSELCPHNYSSAPRSQSSIPTTSTISPSHASITSRQGSRGSQERSPSTFDLTITACSSSRPSRPPSPSRLKGADSSTSATSSDPILSDPFGANPSPPENVTEGIQFGSIQSLNAPLDSAGQFPNVVELTQFQRGSSTKIKNPLFAIQAWNWNRLLTYLMWHGNSRIEPGPLDITEAEDEGLGPWLSAISVIFKEGEGEASVRLVLELVPGNGESQWSRDEVPRGRRHSSVTIGSSSHGKRDEVTMRPHTPEVIHLPNPFLNLPIQLSTLACNLNEIHSVARMSASIHGGITCSFKPHKNKNKNTMIHTKLSKAIENNSKILNEGNDEHQEPDKLMQRGKKWLKKKTIELASSSTPPSASHSTSNLHQLLLQSSSNDNHDRMKDSQVTKVDGNGLPLPDGATMVRPWDCDWS